MSKLVCEFKFEIGEIVYFRYAQHCKGSRPKQFVVTEQLAQRCHADVQRLYKLDGVDRLVAEPALGRKEPEYRPQTKAEIIDQSAARIYEHDSWRDLAKQRASEVDEDDS